MYLPSHISRIMLLSPKGGSGKTTLATNLAGYLAGRGEPTTLIDFDSQGSSTHWLAVRDPGRAHIHGIAAYRNPVGITRSWQFRLPAETRRIIIDTPAAVKGPQLADMVRLADTILIPVLPSHIDIHALAHFMEDLLITGKVRALNTRVGIVANRIRHNTNVFQSLERFLRTLDFPFVGQIREAQSYVRAAGLGVGIHDLPAGRTGRDRAQWTRLLAWIEAPQRAAAPAADTGHSGRIYRTPAPLHP